MLIPSHIRTCARASLTLTKPLPKFDEVAPRLPIYSNILYFPTLNLSTRWTIFFPWGHDARSASWNGALAGTGARPKPLGTRSGETRCSR